MGEPNIMGLVMTGGGARGAYQAGVLKRIGELFSRGKMGEKSPFRIIAGASAGAINGTMLAAGSEDMVAGTRHLAFLWGSIESKHIFRSDIGSLGSRAGKWATDLALGGVIGGGRAESLLDASPLRKLLSASLPIHKIQENIDAGTLKALTVIATNYSTGKSVFFIQGEKGLPLWSKSRRVALADTISVEHVLASAAIPVLFQPVLLRSAIGNYYYGDGCLRLTTPLSPAIRLGADKILAIGVRSANNAEPKTRVQAVIDERADPGHSIEDRPDSPPIAQIVGVILNAIFLDHLDADVEHLKRMNDLVRAGAVQIEGVKEPIRQVKALAISPSVDLGALAREYSSKIPSVVRYMLKGLGTKESETSDLLSYLLFDPDYAGALLDIGYKDASRRIDEIEQFLRVDRKS